MTGNVCLCSLMHCEYRRIALQKDLGTSPAELVLGVPPAVPGVLVPDEASAKMSDIQLLNFMQQKAASTAISFIVQFPELSELVKDMAIIAQEEMSHFEMVHNIILKRGMVMGRERKDQYVLDLYQFFPKGGSRSDQLVHRLLCAALIEARSCERFRLLSKSLSDKSLRKFYRKHDLAHCRFQSKLSFI